MTIKNQDNNLSKSFKKIRFVFVYIVVSLFLKVLETCITNSTVQLPYSNFCSGLRGSARLCRCAGSPEHQFAARLWDKYTKFKVLA